MSVIDYIFGYVYVPIKFIKITKVGVPLLFPKLLRYFPEKSSHISVGIFHFTHSSSTAQQNQSPPGIHSTESNHHHLHNAASQLPRQTFYFPPAICLTSWQLVRQSNPKMTKRNCHNANLKS